MGCMSMFCTFFAVSGPDHCLHHLLVVQEVDMGCMSMFCTFYAVSGPDHCLHHLLVVQELDMGCVSKLADAAMRPVLGQLNSVKSLCLERVTCLSNDTVQEVGGGEMVGRASRKGMHPSGSVVVV